MNHKADTFAQRDLTEFNTKGTDADAGVLTTALCSIIYSIMLCNIMRLQYPGPKGLGVSCSTKFPQSLVQETEAKLQTAREALG